MTHLPTLPLIMALANEAGAENPPEGWSSPRQLPKEWIEATGDSITLGAAEPEVSRLTARREAAAEAAFDQYFIHSFRPPLNPVQPRGYPPITQQGCR